MAYAFTTLGNNLATKVYGDLYSAAYAPSKGDAMKHTALVALAVVLTGFANIGNATPFGMSEIAQNHDLDEGAKNHGAVVSEAARHHGGGASALNHVGSVNSQSTSLLSAQDISSSVSVPEAPTWLLLGAALLGLASCRPYSRGGHAV